MTLGLLPLIDVAPSTGAGIITAVATLITAIATLLGVFAVLVPILRNTRVTAKGVAQVHTIVNQQRTDAQRYQIALTQLLEKHGIEVPIDQSLPVAGKDDA